MKKIEGQLCIFCQWKGIRDDYGEMVKGMNLVEPWKFLRVQKGKI